MAAIGVRGVKETQSMLIAIQEKLRQSLDTQRSLVRVMTGTHRACSHRQPARLNPRLPDGHGICRAELLRQRGQRQHSLRKCMRTEQGSSRAVRGVVNELPAPHNSLLGEGLGPDTTCFGRMLRVWVMDFFAPDNLTPDGFGQSLLVATED